MTAAVLAQCPICRARLDGDGPCRRCRAELGSVRRVAERSAAVAAAGLHRLAAGDPIAALRLLRRANTLRKTPDLASILSALDVAAAMGEWEGEETMVGRSPDEILGDQTPVGATQDMEVDQH